PRANTSPRRPKLRPDPGVWLLGGIELAPDPPVPRLDDDVVTVAALQVRVAERHLAIWSVEHVGRDGEPARPAAELPKDLDPALYGHAEGSGALKQLRLVAVVGTTAHPNEALSERLHGRRVVVDPAEKHALVADRNPGAEEAVACLRRLGGELLRVIEVRVYPDRVVALEHPAERIGHPERERHRQPRPH